MTIRTAHILELSPRTTEGQTLAARARVGMTLAQAARALGGPEPRALRALLGLEAAGEVRLAWPPDDPALAAVLGGGAPAEALLAADPGLHNVVAYEAEWERYAPWFDFVEREDDNAHLKRLERDVYLAHLAPWLDALRPGARVLDAGCGAGRLLAPLLARGLRVTLVDASPRALRCAVRHALALNAEATALEARPADVRRMAFLADGAFDLTLALEVICYQSRPADALAELVRVTRPGGLVAVSVEGLHGGLLHEPRVTLENAARVLSERRLLVEHDLYVRYYTPGDLRAELEAAGLEPLSLVGCHFVPDGPLARLLDERNLAEPATRDAALALDATCASDPALAPLARAWLAVGRKKGA